MRLLLYFVDVVKKTLGNCVAIIVLCRVAVNILPPPPPYSYETCMYRLYIKYWGYCIHSHSTVTPLSLVSVQGVVHNLFNAELFCTNHGDQKVLFKFVISINVLVSLFRFIWIPMFWVYGHFKYFCSYSAGIDFNRDNLTSTDVRFWRSTLIVKIWGLQTSDSDD